MNAIDLEKAYVYRPVADIAKARRISILQTKAHSLAQSLAALLPQSPTRDMALEVVHSVYRAAASQIESQSREP
jgi:hypothetical protein